MSLNKQLSLLGLAMKAGKVVSGEFAVEKYVKEGKAHLVLVAEDASKSAGTSLTVGSGSSFLESGRGGVVRRLMISRQR